MNKQSHINENIADAKSDYLPGVAIDKADNDKVTPGLVEQQTCEMNNNPRNSDMQDN